MTTIFAFNAKSSLLDHFQITLPHHGRVSAIVVVSAGNMIKQDVSDNLQRQYESPAITVTIGTKQYCISSSCLRKCPRFENQEFPSSSITLFGIHEEIGHSFVHFLYTGSYETTNDLLEHGETYEMREYRRGVLVWDAARTYELPALEALARKQIEKLSEVVAIADILKITQEVFYENQVPAYIQDSLKRSFWFNKWDFDIDEMYETLGYDHRFDITVTKMMLQILFYHLENKLEGGESQSEQTERQNSAEDTTMKEEPTPTSHDGFHADESVGKNRSSTESDEELFGGFGLRA